MMTNCPTCGKPVDTLRARAVSVRDGKVIAFCSQECKAAAETRPVVVPVAAPTIATMAEPIFTTATTTKSPTPTPASRPTPMPEPKKGKKRKLTSESPVIEIVHEPASGVVTSAPDRRDVNVTTAQTASASTAGSTTIPDDKVPAKPSPKASDGKTTPIAAFKLDEFKNHEPGDASAKPAPDADEPEVAEPPKRKTLMIAVVVILVLGGGAILAYKLLDASRSNAATLELQIDAAVARATPTPPPPPPSSTPPVTSAAAVDRALAILRAKLTATPKVALAAAAALARTHDQPALAVLTKLLPQQSSDIGKLEVAYQLARGGDPHGKELIAADLVVESRERRLEAARLLARLGDPRATQALENYVEYPQFRMSTAVLLAEVKDAKALKILDDIIGDAKASDDDKASATIALAIAGRPNLTDKLHGYLVDNRFNTQAAAALARLHDAAARPLLVEQLSMSSLRVSAALSLRALEPELDAAPLLSDLLDQLEGSKDTEQVLAAEAILVLAGDRAWSTYE